ncbi:methyltransferase FkbM [Lachnospiraceae bacterium KM106-2]|nr:methyltransferase FkbM [Lachnospiraceae bacterium KM106-2]
MIKESCVYNEFLARFEKSKEKKAIFGAGILGEWFYEIFKDVDSFKIECFIDNKKSGNCKGIPIVPLEAYKEQLKTSTIIICSWLYHEEQYEQLLGLGVLKENMIDVVEVVHQIWNERQYFDLPEFNALRTEQEVFIDGGCFNGQNSIRFQEWCNGTYQKIYAFEPDDKNYENCKITFEESLERGTYELFNCGLGEEKKVLKFKSDNNAGSKFTDSGENSIEVVCLDGLVKEKVSFIKFDIEGAECDAIQGAKALIQEYKPKLAICVYHKPEDIWEIPQLLLKYNPDYKFYFRHYSINEWETVLYAI